MSMRSVAARAERAPTPSSKPRNRPEVFVLVPRSPYSEGIGTRTANDFRNPPTPLRVHNMQSAASTSVTIKRKRSEEPPNETESRVSAPETKTKRRKVSQADTKTQGATRATHMVASNATPEFPNGFFYCHQCNKKRDAALGLYCTFNNKTNLLARCRAKYCRPCLKNRYGQDSDEIKARGINGTSKEIAGHDKTQGYIFKHVPNAHAAVATAIVVGAVKPWALSPPGTQGSPPGHHVLISIISNLTIAAKKTGVDSVAVMLDGNAKMTGILPGKGRQIPDPPKKPKAPKLPRAPDAAVVPKPKRSINRQAKPLPKVTWTPLPVPPSFTLDRALPRIAIREFVLRFGRLLDMSRAHLEELEEIGGRRPHEVDDADSDSEQDIDVEMGWISEICLRAILLGLLNILSEVELGGKQGKKAIQDAIQEIKASRANLTRIWGALANPLSPPQHTKIRTTRSGALNGAGVNVATTAQLVPVVLPLIEMVLDTQAVHDELEEGIKEAKERAKEEKEAREGYSRAVGFEKEEWQPVRSSRPNELPCTAHAPRFSPLGIDHEGRTYFALTPSMAERDAAAALLAGDTSKGGKAHGRAIVITDERQAMRRWGWTTIDEESDDDSATGVERWWGLWQADEIRKLADWIAIKNGFVGGEHLTERNAEDEPGSSCLTPLSGASDTEDEAILGDGPDAGNAQTRVDEDGRVIPTQNELGALVRALREYVEVLDWRAWRMEEEQGVDGKENGAAKKTKAEIRTVSPANFYGR
ncbi:hypothetical protein EDB83DRAFT_2677915 [Lactarius deliciosus]|nr:hypothetical protein EDB83DRAFT_2677915 [Lactarius deliciosus]